MVYSETIKRLEEKLTQTYAAADTLENNLAFNLEEYYKTRDELIALISNPKSDEDFEAAKLKIDELQQRIKALRKVNTNISEENKQLYAVLEELKQQPTLAAIPPKVQTSPVAQKPRSQTDNSNFTEENRTANTPVQSMSVPASNPASASPVTPTNANTTAQPKTNSVGVNATTAKPRAKFFSVSNLNLEAGNRNNDNLELIGSFAIKNLTDEKIKGDILIVVTQPNGKVLQKSPWESGTFQSDNGRKIYSCRLRIENEKGEAKMLTFSLPGNKNLSGIYTVQIYHNGILIGNTQKQV
jgi:regulator of replication initiation timing